MDKLSLKTQNLAPLSALILLQFIIAYFITRGSADLSQLDSLQSTSGMTIAVGAVSAWFSYLLPMNWKNTLVFFRFKHTLPGHRFVQLAEADARIDIELLKNLVPEFESLRNDQARQNQYWYCEIYRPNVDNREVASAHKAYLLYRDAAAVSLICTALLGACQFLLPANLNVSAQSIAIFLVFFAGFILAANAAGKRFVTTAVAMHLIPSAVL